MGRFKTTIATNQANTYASRSLPVGDPNVRPRRRTTRSPWSTESNGPETHQPYEEEYIHRRQSPTVHPFQKKAEIHRCYGSSALGTEPSFDMHNCSASELIHSYN